MKTAIEFLVDNLYYLHSRKWNDILEQAKEMEKQQIINAHGNKKEILGDLSNHTYILTGEYYYKETFKKN